MICEQGKVVAIEDGKAFVEVIQQSSCQACSANKACGTKVIKGLFQAKRHYLKLSFAHLAESPKIGDAVEIEINESALLLSSLMVYILPLIGMLSGALAFDALWQAALGDIAAILGAGLGFVTALAVARVYAWTQADNAIFLPKLQRVLKPELDIVQFVDV